MAHKDVVWHHKTDLICLEDVPQIPDAAGVRAPATELKIPTELAGKPPVANVTALQDHGLTVLYHFTDAANLESIRENGLMSASSLESKG